MEYLMTYGWAILIIAVVLGALFQLGVFNSSSFSPRAPPGACQVFRPSGPGTTTNINLMGVCTGQLPQYVAQFNGQTSNTDSGNAAGFNTYPISFGAWIKTTDTSNYRGVVNKYASGSANGYQIWVNAGTAHGFYYRDGTNYARVDGTYVINDGGWHHVMFIVDSTGARLYSDGVVSSHGWTGTAGVETTALNLRVGQYQGGGDVFNGLIANVQLYNASLTANEVQALYIEGMGSAPLVLQNLVGWWPLNGDAKDYSGNNNNGVPTAVTFTSQYGK